MSLDNIIDSMLGPPPSRGKRGGPIHATFGRELNAADVEGLWHVPFGGIESETRPLLRIRNAHHSMARLIAEGRKDVEIAAITGYSPSRISVLKGDPAFKELVAYYKGQVAEVFLNVHERLASVSMGAVEELQERLEEKPEGFANRELMELAELGLDRTGFGPKSTVQQNVAIGLVSMERLASMRKELEQKNHGTILKLLPSDRGAGMGGTDGGRPVAATLEAAGEQGERDRLPEAPGAGTSPAAGGDP